MPKLSRLRDAYRLPGFLPLARVTGVFGDPMGRVLRLPRPKITLWGTCGRAHRLFYDRRTCRARDLSCGDTRVYPEIEVRRVNCRSCGAVKTETLDWHAGKELEKQYMEAQLAKAGTPVARAIEIDELSIRRSHTYRTIVSDLYRRRDRRSLRRHLAAPQRHRNCRRDHDQPPRAG